MAILLKDQIPSQALVCIVLFMFESMRLDSVSVNVYYYSIGICQLDFQVLVVVVDEWLWCVVNRNLVDCCCFGIYCSGYLSLRKNHPLLVKLI